MNPRKVRYSWFVVCLSVFLGFSWTAPAAAGDAADLRLAAGSTLGGVVVSPPPVPQGSLLPGNPGSISNMPQPAFFIKPGLVGIYAQLLSEKPDLPPANLRPVKPYKSPDTPADARKYYLRQIVLKFREGAPVRLRGGNLQIVAEPTALETSARLGRSQLEPVNVRNDLAEIDKVARAVGGSIGRAAPNVDEADLMRLRKRAERNTGAEHPDLNLFYFLYLPELPPERAQSTLQALKTVRSIEVAYFQPIPTNAVDKPPTTTVNVTNSQLYLRPASVGGIDVDFARLFAGGRGEGVRIADIEVGWHDSHEDLPQMGFRFGINTGLVSDDWSNHGTAVLGVLAAEENNYGATGIVPRAEIGWSSTLWVIPFPPFFYYSVGGALLHTGSVLRPGDIALIEQHYPSAATLSPCNNCNCEQWGYVAVETYPFVHAVISGVTGAGIIVVEAAGNGETMVTPASTEDSGAIVVGASEVSLTAAGTGFNSFAPGCFTNFGPRVNVQAWGGNVGSLGYGQTTDLRANGMDADQWYTRTFGGTSSASPIVAGAVALIQGTRSASGLPKLDPIAMRRLLVSTGTPQAVGTTPNIGPMPNLRAAIATYRATSLPDAAKYFFQSPVINSVAPSTAFNILVTFANSGGVPWVGSHTLSVFQGSVWGAPAAMALGSPLVPIMPNSEAVGVFSLKAPDQPGTYNLIFVLRDSSGAVLASSPQKLVVVTAPEYKKTPPPPALREPKVRPPGR